jgi:hypothetical protein
MAAPVINTPAHLEHRIKAPDGRTLAVAEWGVIGRSSMFIFVQRKLLSTPAIPRC